ncbi:hypothetical protein RSD66_04030 [Brevundimonas sp. S1H14]|uniref:hypothetical protein n=1 Tax=Brevundimonas sp. S1H14 TaxID=3078084 RepID=UPI0039EC576E
MHHTLKLYLAKDSELADRAMENRERRRLEQVSGLTGKVIVDGARRMICLRLKRQTHNQ